MDFLKSGVKGATAPLLVQGRALGFLIRLSWRLWGGGLLAFLRPLPPTRVWWRNLNGRFRGGVALADKFAKAFRTIRLRAHSTTQNSRELK